VLNKQEEETKSLQSVNFNIWMKAETDGKVRMLKLETQKAELWPYTNTFINLKLLFFITQVSFEVAFITVFEWYQVKILNRLAAL
jgi:hypothetical protein